VKNVGNDFTDAIYSNVRSNIKELPTKFMFD